MANTLNDLFRDEVLQLEGVDRLHPGRRFTSIYSESDPADRLYLVSSGLVKIFCRGKEGKEVILRIAAPGNLFGEEALAEAAVRGSSAEILQEGVVYIIPRNVLLSFAESRPEFWPILASELITRQRSLERKIEMLCLEDVESRILYFVRELAERLKQDGQTVDFTIPLSQSELASLVGATRETTSTTLNSLARKGVLRLGRRLLIVPSFEALRPGRAPEQSRLASAQAAHP